MYDLLSLCECACHVWLIIVCACDMWFIIVCVCNVWLITVCACDVWFIIIVLRTCDMWLIMCVCACDVWFIIVVCVHVMCVWVCVIRCTCEGQRKVLRSCLSPSTVSVPYLLSHLPSLLFPLCGDLLTPPHKCILEAWSLLLNGLTSASSHFLSGVGFFPPKDSSISCYKKKKRRHCSWWTRIECINDLCTYHLINCISRSDFLEDSASPPAFRYVSYSGSLCHTDFRNPCVLFSLPVDLLARGARTQNLPSQPLPGSPQHPGCTVLVSSSFGCSS